MYPLKILHGVFRNRFARLGYVTMLVLLVLFIAGQVTDDVHWTFDDFLLAAVLFVGVGLIYEFGIKRLNNALSRIYFLALLMLGLVWLWAELAVGVFTRWGS